MGGLDPAKILVILVIALLVLGPEKLPRAARQLGAAWHELTKLRDKFEEEVRSVVPDLGDLPRIPTSPSRAVSGYISGLLSGQGQTSTVAGAGAETETATEPGAPAQGSRQPVLGSAGGSWPDHQEIRPQGDEVPSSWQPLLGTHAQDSTRRTPAVPSWTGGSTLGADAIFVFDEPSMN